MGRKSTGIVKPLGKDRIQFTFWHDGKRFRPSLPLVPNARNLKAAAATMDRIQANIARGTFNLADEFPEFQSKQTPVVVANGTRTLADAAKEFEGGLDWTDFAHATAYHYRRMLKSFWFPKFAGRDIATITANEIDKALAAQRNGEAQWSAKTVNNHLSILKRVFGHARLKLRWIDVDPTEGVKCMELQDATPDTYSVDEAEKLIAAIRRDWGEHEANYVEFGFCIGARPSELVALRWEDCDTKAGRVTIRAATVMGKRNDKTKTKRARTIRLNPRALRVLRRQRELTGLLAHGQVFTHADGKAYHDLQMQNKRWKATHARIKMRVRDPRRMRHTSVTWNLLIGRSPFEVAADHGHSLQVMVKVYADASKGGSESEAAEILRFYEMKAAPVRMAA